VILTQWLFSPIADSNYVIYDHRRRGDTQTLIYSHEFLKLKDKSCQTWTDFEKDVEEFEIKTLTAYCL